MLATSTWERSRGDEPAAATSGLVLPRPDLTPGNARAITVDEVCGGRPLRLGPRVAPWVPRQVFESYGADFSRAADYELDFLVTPELGGTSDVSNLWPQPFRATPWNAHVKDELERLFQAKVCDGSMSLATAQEHLATDWIAAYKRFFDTDRPLRDYDASPIGANDTGALLAEAIERRLLGL